MRYSNKKSLISSYEYGHIHLYTNIVSYPVWLPHIMNIFGGLANYMFEE